MADISTEDLEALTGWKSQEISDLVENSVLPGEIWKLFTLYGNYRNREKM